MFIMHMPLKPVITFFLLLFIIACDREAGIFNFIYISVEDMNPVWGSCGNVITKTPNIDDFAKDAVLFEVCHCQVRKYIQILPARVKSKP